jgi:hypothetical protein
VRTHQAENFKFMTCFLEQHQPFHFCNGDIMCFLWSRNWISKCYIVEFKPQKTHTTSTIYTFVVCVVIVFALCSLCVVCYFVWCVLFVCCVLL